MQETDSLGERLFDSNKTDENCIYFSHNDLENAQEDVLDLSLGNVSLHSVPQILNKFGLDLTVNRNKDNTTIFDDNNYFVKNHVYKLLPITFEEINQELIHMEHDYCSISSGSDKEAEFSKTMEISLIKNRVYRKKREKSSRKENTGFESCQESKTTTGPSNNSLNIVNSDLEKDSQLMELDFSLINLRARISMHHSEVDYSEFLQPLDLTQNIANEKKTEDILEENQLEDKGNKCNPKLLVPEIISDIEDSNNIVVEMMRPNCKDYKPAKTFLSEIAYLAPYLIKNDHGKINILDLSSENVDYSNERKTFYCIPEAHWKTFQNSSERIILTNDKSIGEPVSTNGNDDTQTFLLFDENSLRESLAKHSQDIGASLNYRLLVDTSGKLTKTNIISENGENDNFGDQSSASMAVETENVNDVTIIDVDTSIENNEQPSGIINSGLLKKLLSKCNISSSNQQFSGQIKCNECLKETNPCNKCMDLMNKTYLNRASQNPNKHFRNFPSKKHWSHKVNVKGIFNSNPIVQEMKSKEGNKKKESKGKSTKKKNMSPCTEKKNSYREETLRKSNLESRCIRKPGGIINSGFLKALLRNSNVDSNNAVVNSSNNRTMDNLVDKSDVHDSNKVDANIHSEPSLRNISNDVESSDVLGNSTEVNIGKLNELPKSSIENQNFNEISNSVRNEVEDKREPIPNNENIQKIEICANIKKNVKTSTIKKPRRSLDISIEEIANLGLGVEKRTRSGREVPEVLIEKNKKKKSNKKDLVDIKKEYCGKNTNDVKDLADGREKIFKEKAFDNVVKPEEDSPNILRSLLLDAAKKMAEPCDAHFLCDILPNMENLNIPVTETNINPENKKKSEGKKKIFSKETKKLTLNSTFEPNDIKQGIVNNEEPDSNNEISDNDKNGELNTEGSSEQDVLFFENNLNLDESNRFKEMCVKLENNIAEDIGILSNGFDNGCGIAKRSRGRPKKDSLKNNNNTYLEANEDRDHRAILNPKKSESEIDIESRNPANNASMEEKNQEMNEVKLRFKGTTSEKIKKVTNNNDDNYNGDFKEIRGTSEIYSVEYTVSNLKAADCNNEKSFSTDKDKGVIFSKSGSSKTNLDDIEADFREINMKIKKEVNALNGNMPYLKDRKDSFKKLSGKLATKSSSSKDASSETEPFRIRLRSKIKNENENDSTLKKIEIKGKINGSRKPSVSGASGSFKKRKRSSENVRNLIGILNESPETSQLSKKKVWCELLGKYVNSPLKNTPKEKTFGNHTLDLSMTYERTTRSGKVIESNTVLGNVEIEPAFKKKHRESALLNIEESESENKKEINLRRRTIACSSLKEEGKKRQIEDNTTDKSLLKKQKTQGRNFEFRNEANKNGKISISRFSRRLRNK